MLVEMVVNRFNIKMQKIDSPVKSVVVEMKDKRTKGCWNLRNLHNKLASAANFCRANKSIPVTVSTVECDPNKDEESVKQKLQSPKIVNDQRDSLRKDQNTDENLNEITENAFSDPTLNQIPEANIKEACFLDDILLQNEVRGVAERLQVLLHLQYNTVKKPSLCEYSKLLKSSTVLLNDLNADISLKLTWDGTCNTLSVKLLPPANSAVPNQRKNQNDNAKPTCNQLTTIPSSCLAKLVFPATPLSSKSASPATPRRHLSSRNSTDSGFFSTCFN